MLWSTSHKDYVIFASKSKKNTGLVKRASFAFADGKTTWKEFKNTVLLGLDQIDNDDYEKVQMAKSCVNTGPTVRTSVGIGPMMHPAKVDMEKLCFNFIIFP